MQRKILFVGGGSLGHVLPSLAAWEEIKRMDPTVSPVFVTANRAEEIDTLWSQSIDVCPLSAPKFPRGFSFRSFIFPFFFCAALIRSWRILHAQKPDLVFSKGGYISVPVCLIAVVRRIPIILHTSDSVPSLSDLLIGRFARIICTGFPIDAFPTALRSKAQQTGNPVRAMFRSASRSAGIRITGFSGKRPVVMITGGSQGATSINEEVERIFDELIDIADVIHLTGAGKSIPRSHARYFSRPLIREDLPHLYALADIVVTRAGAGALAELAALAKPIIVIPLEGVAHDHQVCNARFLATGGAIDCLPQAEITSLLPRVRLLLSDAERRTALGVRLQSMLSSHAATTIATIALDVLHSTPLHS